MDETTPKPSDTDPRLTGRWQSLVDTVNLRQATLLYIPGKD